MTPKLVQRDVMNKANYVLAGNIYGGRKSGADGTSSYAAVQANDTRLTKIFWDIN
jgi:hypothetical protein